MLQDFGYVAPSQTLGAIGDKVWYDADGDGAGPYGHGGAPGDDHEEKGIPGVLVNLLDASNNVIAQATTGANGDYLFTGLPVDADGETYTVEIDPSNLSAGGPLAGRSLPHPEVVIDQTTSCLTVMSRQVARRPPPQTCLRCGWCLDGCPVGLDPAALMNLAEQFAYDRAEALHPEACIECGICSYVCPAHLDLARAVRDLKQARRLHAEAKT